MPTRSPVEGICIYCRTLSSNLGDEHIVPASLGGKVLIRSASCQSCERITSRFENHCADRMLRPALTHIGIRGRTKIKRSQVAVKVGKAPYSKRHKMPVTEHPGMLWMFSFSVAGILFGNTSSTPPVGRIITRPIHENIDHRLKNLSALGPDVSLIDKPFDAAPFARLLAKIAHCHLVAEIGFEHFEPLLPTLILNDHSDEQLLNYVGTHIGKNPESSDLHSIWHSKERGTNGVEYYVVHIRLFGQYDMPMHYVVAGLPK